MEFNFNLPVNIIFGRGKLSLLGEIAAQYGKHALLCISSGSAIRSGLFDRVTESLTVAGVEYTVFDKIEANPLTTTALAAAEAAKSANCDMVIGAGGGSIMDAAKAAAFCAVNDGDISDYIFAKRTSGKALPIILVPTTCGTGSEGNGFAVLTNPANGDKKSLRCPATIAKASIVDPALMRTLPKKVLASVSFDAFCHCMDAYVSKNVTPISSVLALEGMRLFAGSAEKAVNGNANENDWDSLTLASTLGGMAIGMAGVTATHALEHPASGLRNIVHGEGLAALAPEIIKRSAEFAPEKYATIASILAGIGGSKAQDCGTIVRSLLDRIGLSFTLSDLGVLEEDIPWMAENAQKVSAPSLAAHPYVFTREEIAEIYRICL